MCIQEGDVTVRADASVCFYVNKSQRQKLKFTLKTHRSIWLSDLEANNAAEIKHFKETFNNICNWKFDTFNQERERFLK